MQERRRQEEERLLAALPHPMGFHKGRPMAAMVVFRCCLQWRAFQADRTSVFDRIIHVRWLGLRLGLRVVLVLLLVIPSPSIITMTKPTN